jgi:hypothetical protein
VRLFFHSHFFCPSSHCMPQPRTGHVCGRPVTTVCLPGSLFNTHDLGDACFSSTPTCIPPPYCSRLARTVQYPADSCVQRSSRQLEALMAPEPSAAFPTGPHISTWIQAGSNRGGLRTVPAPWACLVSRGLWGRACQEAPCVEKGRPKLAQIGCCALAFGEAA